MIKVYGIPNCNTVKKAIEWLQQNELEYDFHDYKKEGDNARKVTGMVQLFWMGKFIEQKRYHLGKT